MQLRQIGGTVIIVMLFISEPVAQNLDQIGKKGGIKITGGVSVNNVLTLSNAPGTKIIPYAYYLNGNLNIDLYGIAVPLSFNYSNRKFGYQQPFNVVGFSPKYKWITFHGGYRSMAFGQYSFNGMTFLGGGIEMTPPKSRVQIQAMGGRLTKATPFDTANASKLPSYERLGTGTKLTYTGGSDKISLVWFYATDKLSSLAIPLDRAGITPKENMVWSTEFSKAIFKKLSLTGEFAVSALTMDLRQEGKFTKQSSWNSLFFMNKNATTDYYKSYRANLGYTFNLATVGLGYERVDPGYSTLGAYYFNNDLENYSLNIGTKLFKGKVNLSGRTGLQRDNLDKSKLSSSERWANSFNVGIAAGKRVSLTISYSDFKNVTNIRPNFLTNTIVNNPYSNLDTLNYIQITKSLSVSSSINISKNKDKPSPLSITASVQGASEKKQGKVPPGAKIYNGSMSYSIKQSKQWPVSTGFTFGCNVMNSPVVTQVSVGPGMNFARGFFKDKLKASMGVGAGNSYLNGKSSGPVMNYNLSASGSPAKHHSISFSAVFTRRTSVVNGDAAGVLRNFSASLGYNFSF